MGLRPPVGLTGAARSRVLSWVFVAYLVVVAVGVFGPSPGEPVHQAGDGVRRVADEVVPGRTDADRRQVPRDQAGFGGLSDEDVANVALFVPFGMLFPSVFARWRWWTVPGGVALTVTIELVQKLLWWRTSSIGDIGWNSLGALIGFGLWLMASAMAAMSRRRSPAVAHGAGSAAPR